MKKSELKALILECKQELAEENASQTEIALEELEADCVTLRDIAAKYAAPHVIAGFHEGVEDDDVQKISDAMEEMYTFVIEGNEGPVEESADKKQAIIDAIIESEGPNPEDWELASYLYNNYASVTGDREDDRDEEQSFPTIIDDIVEHFGIDMGDFEQAWGE